MQDTDLKKDGKGWLYMTGLAIGMIVLSFAIYNITHLMLTHLGVEQRLAETIGRLLASIFILVIFRWLYGTDSFFLKNKAFLKGMAAGWFMIGVIILNLTISMMELQEFPFSMPSVYLITIVIIEQLFVGAFEEFLYRGFVLNVFLIGKKGGKGTGKAAAIVISSVLFGLTHFLNLFDSPQLILATLAQFFYATFIGIYFAVLYLKTENIWVVVILHAFSNLAGDLPPIFYVCPEGAVSDIGLVDFGINVLLNGIFVIAALLIYRNSFKKGRE